MMLLFGLFISFLWGITPVVHKHILKDISPVTTLVGVSVFYTFCTIVFAYVYRKQIHDDVTKHLTVRHTMYIAFTAVVCGFLGNMLYLTILQHHPSHLVSGLIYSSPVFTMIIAYFVLKEEITLMGFFGIMFIVAGVLLIAFNKK